MLQKPWTEKHLKSLSSAGKKEIQEREIEIQEMVDESQECHETVSLGFKSKQEVQSLGEREPIALHKGCGTA